MKFFNLDRDSKIFVYCPANAVTGGAELLHQLVDIINRNGGNAYIVYFGDAKREIPSDYNKYNIKLANCIEDKESNIVVLYEGCFRFIRDIHKAQVMLWWLSVDNYYYGQLNNVALRDLFQFSFYIGLKQLIKRTLKLFSNHDVIFTLNELKKNKLVVCNGYQSEYAKAFLSKKGFLNICSLKDYINTDYQFSDSIVSRKKNIVLYNPKKGLKFTKKLICYAPDIKWVPIQNMNRAQVKEIMLDAKVYIDFGYHPGKDRLPREAAMSGCCLVTGKLGSAGYYGDISIDESIYKFNQKKRDIPLIIDKIRYLLENYMFAINDFAIYRDNISKEKDEFESDAVSLFINH